VSGPQRYVVRVQDREHEVRIDPDGRVSVDDLPYEVITTGDGLRIVRQADQSAQTRVVLSPEARPREAGVESLRIPIEVKLASEAALEAALGGAGARASDGVIKAPMPGRVVKVLVEAGQRVSAGVPVIIVEAMKMENELTSPVDGEVTSIAVAAGDAVDAGAVLLEIQIAEVGADS